MPTMRVHVVEVHLAECDEQGQEDEQWEDDVEHRSQYIAQFIQC